MLTSQPAPYAQAFPMAPQQSAMSASYANLPLQKPANGVASRENLFTSPTESEFSEGADQLDPIRSWDEKKVGEWLHSIRCGQYEPVFKANHFTGDNLLDCDQKILQEMGIKKVGDRVRIYVAVKQLRNRTLSYRKKRNRDSLAALDSARYTPPSSESSRPSNPRYHPSGRQWSRNEPSSHSYGAKPSSRPTSPLTEADRQIRSFRYNGASPMESIRREQGPNYFSYSHSNSSTSRHTTSSNDPSQAPRTVAHVRQNPSNDGLTISSLPSHSPVIRVIHTGGQTKALNIKQCKTADDIMVCVLKKLLLPESHYKNYCFYVLDGLDPNPANCRRISDIELLQICDGSNRSERGRLILRNIHAGEPDLDELELAARLATDESQVAHMNAMNTTNLRNQIKLQKLTGESWDHLRQPMSPITATDRSRDDHRRLPHTPSDTTDRDQGTKLRSFFGARPPSEMIIHELTSYFPSHQKEDIEKTMRLSVRRSQRMSRAASRLSVMSGVSLASSMKDAPPIPSIADAWLSAGAASNPPSRAGGGRPLSVSRFNLPQASFRDSIASSALEPLQEESPIQDNRKSYVSFDESSDHPIIEEPERQTFLDETLSVTATDGGGSMNERLSMIVAEDGDEVDDGLADFLAGNNFGNKNWMKGSLIGEGSFGSVFLALHSVTGELMAVKQVELPSATKGTEFDQKKNLMVTALKHEIGLLQGLQHENIVQYLGTSTDDQYLNIFLEYVPGGSIATMLKQYNTFQEPLIRNFVRQILAGLEYLHSRDIIHRDIKGANVLVDNKGGIKISDFGISKRVEASTMLGSGAKGPSNHLHRPSLQGSVYWMAPEVVRQTAHTKKADIWSLGCLVVEMFIGVHPFPDCSQLQAIFAIGNNQARPPPPENASKEAMAFLDMTFEIDHEKRPSADELLTNPFLETIA
ncbi:MAP kinase kinase kinase Ste11/SteC [Arthroderma uncinatum]|uniref:MAP kinase kinase kinase Ste11/SteC n=1 Tax=Arthroderma uncinatum TaxID=74035 RepID=UPI00144A5499|nr:MAP kinase kinase kinase Ste11/SteC [Arthroderma uncinatum]KAF3482415.1 MAP kinase kinase kinase Ste11/SteC [Arthroderma uncinatum]